MPKHPPELKAPAPPAFDWPLCSEAERRLRSFVDGFLSRHDFARRLAGRMREETGTDFFEWVDHFVLGTEHEPALRAAGLVPEDVERPPGVSVSWHPRAMLPRVLLRTDAAGPAATGLAIRPELLPDFIAAHDLGVEIEGAPDARFRRALVSEEGGTRFYAIQRLACRGFLIREPTAEVVMKLAQARELWRTRRRNFARDADGVRHAFERLDAVLALVDRDAACDTFFAEERRFWESRNRAAQIQKRRQDRLGLGWGNHDHHTFRCSREQLAAAGVNTMKPFSNFEFLRQAFTEGERWPVRPERVAALRERGLITTEQADGFLRDGAIGSHLENLQRKGGFKGFNQKSVSAIIAATDPRKIQAGHPM